MDGNWAQTHDLPQNGWTWDHKMSADPGPKNTLSVFFKSFHNGWPILFWFGTTIDICNSLETFSDVIYPSFWSGSLPERLGFGTTTSTSGDDSSFISFIMVE